jgi:hypothetical protein
MNACPRPCRRGAESRPGARTAARSVLPETGIGSRRVASPPRPPSFRSKGSILTTPG